MHAEDPANRPLEMAQLERIEALRRGFEDSCQSGSPLPIETLLEEVSAEARPRLLCELLLLEIPFRQRQGEKADVSQYRRRFPDYADTVDSVFRRIAAALDFAHARGVIHRDLKPENVCFTKGASSRSWTWAWPPTSSAMSRRGPIAVRPLILRLSKPIAAPPMASRTSTRSP